LKSLKFIALILLLFTTACGGQGSGYAPGAPQPPVTPPVVDTSGDHLFKYGQITTTSGGWEASYDSSDPVEEITLANGWTIEVKNE
jgi:hypothetical protein